MATGVKSATYDYNAFGETIQSDGVASVANHFRFSTKYTDDETGLLYYGYRFYQPSTGRWPSRDPIEERGGKNLYAFIKNNPIAHFDALGLYIWNYVAPTLNVRTTLFPGSHKRSLGLTTTPESIKVSCDKTSGIYTINWDVAGYEVLSESVITANAITIWDAGTDLSMLDALAVQSKASEGEAEHLADYDLWRVDVAQKLITKAEKNLCHCSQEDALKAALTDSLKATSDETEMFFDKKHRHSIDPDGRRERGYSQDMFVAHNKIITDLYDKFEASILP